MLYESSFFNHVYFGKYKDKLIKNNVISIDKHFPLLHNRNIDNKAVQNHG